MDQWHLLSVYNDAASLKIFHNGQVIAMSPQTFTNTGDTLEVLLIPGQITPFLRSFYYFPFESPELYSLWTRRSSLVYEATFEIQFTEDNWILKDKK